MYGGDFCLWSRWNNGLGFPSCLKQLKMGGKTEIYEIIFQDTGQQAAEADDP